MYNLDGFVAKKRSLPDNFQIEDTNYLGKKGEMVHRHNTLISTLIIERYVVWLGIGEAYNKVSGKSIQSF